MMTRRSFENGAPTPLCKSEISFEDTEMVLDHDRKWILVKSMSLKHVLQQQNSWR